MSSLAANDAFGRSKIFREGQGCEAGWTPGTGLDQRLATGVICYE